MIAGLPQEQWETIAPALEIYEAEVRAMNRRFGLVAASDLHGDHPRRFLERHILDSLLPWRQVDMLLQESGRQALYDLGSGAGLPGIPLGLLFARRVKETVLVERRGKRVSFLLGVVPRVCARLVEHTGEPRLAGAIRVLEGDAATLHTHKGAHLREAMVVFRAYHQITREFPVHLAAVFPEGTPVCAWKGLEEHAEEELQILRSSHSVRSAVLHHLPSGETGVQRTALTWYVSHGSASHQPK